MTGDFYIREGVRRAVAAREAGLHERIADLADALEILPGLLDRSEADDKHDLIRFVLKTYQEKHKSNCDFVRRFEEFEVPKHF